MDLLVVLEVLFWGVLCPCVQAVSCDEAFLDVTGQGDPCNIASTIRSQIFEATRCTASAGVSGNMLLARLATRKAKPNGLYYLAPTQVGRVLSFCVILNNLGVTCVPSAPLQRANILSVMSMKVYLVEGLSWNKIFCVLHFL